MNTERRSVSLVDAEMKGHMFRGLAAVFDTPWSDRLTEAAGYREVVKRGAFRKALASGENVPFLLEHDPHQLLGTTQSGNVKISEDARGLLVEAKMPDNPLSQYARSLIDAGDMRGMSYGIALDPKTDTMLTRSGNVWTRAIVGAKRLLDVSLTWQPAYNATEVSLRSTGFVATPLQELLDGTETQIEDAATEESPDEPDAEWVDAPSLVSTPAEGPRPWWDFYIDQLEKEI